MKNFNEGFNKADPSENRQFRYSSVLHPELLYRSCIFLSHKSEDKPACRLIAQYLSIAGIDYYLDEENMYLQAAASANDPHRITEAIKKGINASTHMLCVVSDKTLSSPWIPFEVGYGHAAIIDKSMEPNVRGHSIKLAILTLKELAGKELPDLMKVGYQIRSIQDINDYISKLLNTKESDLYLQSRLALTKRPPHPLEGVLIR